MKPDFFTKNREHLRRKVRAEVIVVAANGLMQRNSDNAFPFRQDSSFWYLTGVDEPDLVLVMDGSDEYLIVPHRDAVRTSFDGSIENKALASVSGISEILDEKAGWQRLKAGLAAAKTVATPAAEPALERHHGIFTNPARARLLKKLKTAGENLELIDIRRELAALRVIKQPEEIALIQKAIDITAQGIEMIRASLADFTHEYEIEAELTKQFRAGGADGHSFAPIVAGGSNACTLHNVANKDKLRAGELIVIDVGAEVNNYAADLTRTLAIGKPSVRQREVYDAVKQAQDFALGLLKPGTDMHDYESQVADFMGEKLVELGLISSPDDKASIRRYCPHATSHFMGLDVHDTGDYRQPLKENMVLTCEPGIYIPEEKIGVRIEDDVLITATGNRVLSQKLPRELC